MRLLYKHAAILISSLHADTHACNLYISLGQNRNVNLHSPDIETEQRPQKECLYSFAPQYLQCSASGSCPSAPQVGQASVLICFFMVWENSTVTIPVGTAIMP
jgi:hypothetical protein